MEQREDNAEGLEDVNSEHSPIKVTVQEIVKSKTRVREAPNSSSPRPKEIVSDYDQYLMRLSHTPQINFSPNIQTLAMNTPKLNSNASVERVRNQQKTEVQDSWKNFSGNVVAFAIENKTKPAPEAP